ncbi:hypothetical protein ACMX25_09615 [Caballeronia sp. 15715]|uniref:hypothetical protein n=1 Tax=Caballeronia sp. 15715 TaxID=3391030 RepID=UPI0039E2886D
MPAAVKLRGSIHPAHCIRLIAVDSLPHSAKTSRACQSHDFVAIIAGFEAPESAFGTFRYVADEVQSTAASRLLSTFFALSGNRSRGFDHKQRIGLTSFYLVWSRTSIELDLIQKQNGKR